MARDFTAVDMARLPEFLQFGDECFSHAAVRKTFIHCFVEREVFLFAATDLSSSISSFETTGNLETSAASSCCVVVVVVVFGFGSGGLETVRNCSNIWKKVGDHLIKTDSKSWKIICQ